MMMVMMMMRHAYNGLQLALTTTTAPIIPISSTLNRIPRGAILRDLELGPHSLLLRHRPPHAGGVARLWRRPATHANGRAR
jgi:hypothetical protein